MQNQRTGIRFVPVFIRAAVVEGNGQRRLIQPERLQFFIRDVVADIVCQVKARQRCQPCVDVVGIERLAVCEVHIVRADARAVLVIADGVVFRARERDFLRGVKGRDGIVEDHIPQHRAELIQRVVADQVSLAVADGDIPLLVHLAEIAELDGIGFLASCDGDRANWLCQAVLCVILHIVNGKRRREILELRKQIVDFSFVHRERRIAVIRPCIALCERERPVLIRP